MNKMKQFHIYFNGFHGKNGIYPSDRHVGMVELMDAVAKIEGDSDFNGDSLDREKVRDIIFSDKEQEKMYARKTVTIENKRLIKGIYILTHLNQKCYNYNL